MTSTPTPDRTMAGIPSPIGGMTLRDFTAAFGIALGESNPDETVEGLAGILDVAANRQQSPGAHYASSGSLFDVVRAIGPGRTNYEFNAYGSREYNRGVALAESAALDPAGTRLGHYGIPAQRALAAMEGVFGPNATMRGITQGSVYYQNNSATNVKGVNLDPQLEIQRQHGSVQVGAHTFTGPQFGRATTEQPKEDPTNLLASQPPDARFGNPDEAARAHAAFGGVTNKGPDEGSRALGAAFSGETDWDALASLNTPSEAAGKGFLEQVGSSPDDTANGLPGQVGQPFPLEVEHAFPNTDYDAVAGFSRSSPSWSGEDFDAAFADPYGGKAATSSTGYGGTDASAAEQFGPTYTPDPTLEAEQRQDAAIAASGYSPSWSGENFDAAFADPYGGYAATSSTGYAGSAPADPYGGRAAVSSTGTTPTGGGLDMSGFNAAMAQFDRDMAAYNSAVSNNQARDFPATANPNSGLQPSSTIGTGANFGVPGSAGSYWGMDQFAEDPNNFSEAMKGSVPTGLNFSVPQAAPTAARAPAPAVGPRPVAPTQAAFTKTAAAPAPAAAGPSGGQQSFSDAGLAPGVSYEGSISGRSTNDAFGNNMDTFMGPNWSDSGQMYASTTGGNTDMTGKGVGFGSLSPSGGSQDQNQSLGAFGGILDAIVAAAAAEAFGGQQAGFGGYADPYGGGAYNDAGGYNYR